ncbi:MAG: ABC transporter substrate-binding protein [Chloroflexi bacterium]|nr:ABC transporter substrate-binding protein [Chloroflexota bacterium]
MKRNLVLAVLLALAFLAAGCAQQAPATRIRIGLLPIIDTLPFHVAELEGYFSGEGLEVELVTFTSARDRDIAIQTGAIEGQLADLIASGLLNKESPSVKIVKTTYRAMPDVAMISLVAGPKSDIASPEQLRGARVGISHNTIMEYLTDRLLREAGLAPDLITKEEVPQIPLRMQMLAQGQLDAAALPEPLTTLAVQSGGRVILSDRQSLAGLSVLEFRSDFLSQQGDAVRRFVRAHEKAVETVNHNPDRYRALLADKARLPESVKESFQVPAFPQAQVPSPEDVRQAVDWMVEKKLVPHSIPYADLVDDSFVRR